MNKYQELIKQLRDKKIDSNRIKEIILDKAKKETNNFQANFKKIQVKQLEDSEDKVIQVEGYASTKDVDRYGDVVEPGAFEETMELFMKNPVLLLQHDHDKRIGDVTEYNIDNDGLYIKADVKYTGWDDELFKKIENKSLKGFSIGWRVLEAEFKDITDADGKVIDWVFVVKKLDLVEISVVNVPANPYTLMKSIQDLGVKNAEELDIEEIQKKQELKDEEEDKKTVDEEPKVDIVENEDDNSENLTEMEDGKNAGVTDLEEKTLTPESLKAINSRFEDLTKTYKENFEEMENRIKSLEGKLAKTEDEKEDLKKSFNELSEKLANDTRGKGFLNVKPDAEVKKEEEANALIKRVVSRIK